MKPMHKNDIIAICSFIVATASGVTAVTGSLQSIAGPHTAQVAAIVALLGFLAGNVIRVYSNPAPTTKEGQ